MNVISKDDCARGAAARNEIIVADDRVGRSVRIARSVRGGVEAGGVRFRGGGDETQRRISDRVSTFRAGGRTARLDVLAASTIGRSRIFGGVDRRRGAQQRADGG